MSNYIRAKRTNMFLTSKSTIENKYQPGSGVGAQSTFVKNALKRRSAIKKNNKPYLSLCN